MMVIDAVAADESRYVADVFPLAPIRDAFSYEMAIAILDELFEKGERRSQGELAYFRSLACIAAAYEEANGMGAAAPGSACEA